MPAIGFTKFKEKILKGTKKQTIRAVKKRKYQIGDTLYLYWHLRQKDCELLKVVKCTEVFKVAYRDFAYSDRVAILDGFENSKELRDFFNKVHKPFLDDMFYIIRWK